MVEMTDFRSSFEGAELPPDALEWIRDNPDEAERVLSRIKRGPALPVHTWDTQQVPERKWLVRNWLPANRVSLLAGPGAVGKSRLALQLAAGVASGGSNNTWIVTHDRGTLQMGEAVCSANGLPVIYASWEDEPIEFNRRLAQLSGDAASWIIPDRLQQLYFVNMAGHGPLWGPAIGRHLDTAAGWLPSGEKLRAKAEELEVGLLIVDPSAAAYGGNENARALVRAFVSSFDAWSLAQNCTVLVLSHPPKTGDPISGSTDWHASARAVWTLDKLRKGPKPDDYDAWRLRLLKSNYGPDMPSLELEWDTTGSTSENDALRWQVSRLWDAPSESPAEPARIEEQGEFYGPAE